MPLPSFMASLSPSSCASLSSSPCNSSLLSLCSPYNQVFFMLFCKVPCESIPRSSSASLFVHLLASFSFTSLPLYFQCQDLRKCVAVKKALLFMVDARGFMYWPVPSANLIHYFIHSGHYFGVTGQKWLRQTPFFFITEIWHLSVYERGRESAGALIYAMLSVPLGFTL